MSPTRILAAILPLLLASPAGADDKATMVVLDYGDFGPQAAAFELLGYEWWQWEPHGDSRPQATHVKVVVYRDVDQATVAATYPVAPEKKQDYRYVPYDKALAWLDAAIREDVLPQVTEQLRRTKRRLEQAPTDALRARFAEALGIPPATVVSARYWRAASGSVSPGITAVLAGTWQQDGRSQGALVPLTPCADPQPCATKPRLLGSATSVAPRYVVDLQGAPRRISLDGFPDVGLIDAPSGAAMPALAVQTRIEGAPTSERTLFLLSLADALQTTLLVRQTHTIERDGSGVRMDSLQLNKGDGPALDIVMREQPALSRRSHCLRPEPVDRVWKMESNHYKEVTADTPSPTGCR